jgi:hypothetical protein
MFRPIHSALLATVVLSAANLTLSNEKKFLIVPRVEWRSLLPYIESHVVAQLDGAEFHVFVCTDRVREDLIQPYDQRLGDYAKVLLWEGMRTDRRIERSIVEATEEIRKRIPDLSERGRYPELFWQALIARKGFLPRLRQVFESSQREGRLRCWMCEKDPQYQPHGLQ